MILSHCANLQLPNIEVKIITSERQRSEVLFTLYRGSMWKNDQNLKFEFFENFCTGNFNFAYWTHFCNKKRWPGPARPGPARPDRHAFGRLITPRVLNRFYFCFLHIVRLCLRFWFLPSDLGYLLNYRRNGANSEEGEKSNYWPSVLNFRPILLGFVLKGVF